jgi:hypothetical protein
MAKQVYWLSDAERRRIEPCCQVVGVGHIGPMIAA